ncbi:shikimate dehydrogenase [Nocardioides sp. C4-1]|uniref:shikimate dehydrogenase n=1 Tax=Nocardioides sp. C4-1 TaxID=3151851 RepID=UPI003267665B
MRCAVLGDPIGHSLSPVLHRAAYAALGLDWSYEAVRVPSGGLAGFLAGLDDAWRGLSLTMPLKREVVALGPRWAGESSDVVRLTGAANTVVLDGDRLLLDNTDLPGAAAAIRERWDGDVSRAVVLGAGATAASVGLAMCDLGAREVHLLARSPGRAAETVAVVSAHASAPRVSVGGLDEPVSGDVVVSTIPVAAQTDDLVRRCGEVPVTFEVVYDPWPTPLAAAAEAGGRVLVGGLDLLVHQAVLQVERFTGTPGPLEVMRTAGAEALAARVRSS